MPDAAASQGWSHRRAIGSWGLVFYKLRPTLELCCLLKFMVLFYSLVPCTLINSLCAVLPPAVRSSVLFLLPSTCPFLQKSPSMLSIFSPQSRKSQINSLPFAGEGFSPHTAEQLLMLPHVLKPLYRTGWASGWEWILSAFKSIVQKQHSPNHNMLEECETNIKTIRNWHLFQSLSAVD